MSKSAISGGVWGHGMSYTSEIVVSDLGEHVQ